MSGLFKGLTFSFAGTQFQPETVLRELILKNGGLVEDNVNEQVTHVLSSYEMAGVHGNSYKVQFYNSNFEKQISMANTLHIPVLSTNFLQSCIDQKKIIDITPFVIFGGISKQIDTESSLDPKVQELVKLIFDKNLQTQAILQMSLDASKVNSITHQSIERAYTILSEIEKVLPLLKGSKQDKENATSKVSTLSNEFYGVIPHTKKPTIDSHPVLKDKLSTLEGLEDIVIANKMMNDISKVGRYSVNPIDLNYKKLKTKITPLGRYTHEYDIILDSIKNTKADIHSYFDLNVVDIFEVEREGEHERFGDMCNSMKNHRLLWHGSRISNYIGILSQGLRIAPPEAPVTGYFLGKGVYFADMVSKSIEYCFPTKENPYALLMLCEVSLGRPFQLAHTKFIDKEDLDNAGFNSTRGCGELGPDPAYDIVLSDGVVIAVGKEESSGVPVSELKHNEYIVYDVNQIKIKYLIKLKVTSDKDIKAQSLMNAN